MIDNNGEKLDKTLVEETDMDRDTTNINSKQSQKSWTNGDLIDSRNLYIKMQELARLSCVG